MTVGSVSEAWRLEGPGLSLLPVHSALGVGTCGVVLVGTCPSGMARSQTPHGAPTWETHAMLACSAASILVWGQLLIPLFLFYF